MAVKNFRIGNDLVVLWAICNRDGSPYNLANKQVRLYVMNERGRKEVDPIITTLPDGTVNNVIRWDFNGMDQRVTGLYTLNVEIFTEKDKKSIKKDYCEAFCLVSSSSLEDEDLADNISDGGELILSSSLDVIQLTIPRIDIGTNGNWIIDGVDTGVSALGGGPGLVNKIYNVLDFEEEYDPDSVTDTFNAHAINTLYEDVKDAEREIEKLEEDIYVTGQYTEREISQHKEYTERRFTEAQQTIDLLQNTLDGFSEGITPITVNTMSALVGDVSLQFRFVANVNDTTPQDPTIRYVKDSGQIVSDGDTIQHMTLGIDSMAPTHSIDEYLFWNVAPTTIQLEEVNAPYYVYIKANKNSRNAEYVVSKTNIKLEEVSGYYHLLTGLVTGSGDTRGITFVYGFTEILPSQITTNVIKSSNNALIIDLEKAIIEAKNGALIRGSLTIGSGSSGLEQLSEWSEKQTEINNASTNATWAQRRAEESYELANNAKSTADNAKDKLNEWASDSVISPVEKQALKNEISFIKGDYDDIYMSYETYNEEFESLILADGKELATSNGYTFIAKASDIIWNRYEQAYNLYLSDLQNKVKASGTVAIGNLAALQNNFYSARTAILEYISALIKAAADYALQRANAAISDAESARSYVDIVKKELLDQIDGVVTNWFGDEAPTLDNYPAKDWVTEADKDAHLGDVYYSGEGKVYRFQKNESGVYEWKYIPDNDLAQALELAKKAQDTADGKRRIFVAQPKPPYDEGDLWAGGERSPLKVCHTPKSEVESYSEYDWVLADDSRYYAESLVNDTVNSLNRSIASAEQAAKEYTDEGKKVLEKSIDELNEAKASVNDVYTKAQADGKIEEKELEILELADSYARAAQLAAETNTQAWADGKISEAEQNAINEAKRNLQEAKEVLEEAIGDVDKKVDNTISSLNSSIAAVEQAAKDYTDEGKAELQRSIDTLNEAKASINDVYTKAQADGKISEAEQEAINAAKGYADAAQELAEKNVKAYADGKVDEAERNAIAEAEKKVNAAKEELESSIEEIVTSVDSVRNLANSAKSTADAATSKLNTWASDSVISPVEKQGLRDEIAFITADYRDIELNYQKYIQEFDTLILQDGKQYITEDGYVFNVEKANTNWLAYKSACNAYLNDLRAKVNTEGEVAVGNLQTYQSNLYTTRTAILEDISLAIKAEADYSKQKAEQAAKEAENLKTRFNDIQYLENTFGPGSNLFVEGVVMSKLVAVAGKNEGIEAFLNGSEVISDPEHGKLILAGGIEAGTSSLADRAQEAATRIYEDGSTYSNSLHLLEGCTIGDDIMLGNTVEGNGYIQIGDVFDINRGGVRIAEGTILTSSKSSRGLGQYISMSSCSGNAMSIGIGGGFDCINYDKDVGLRVNAPNAYAILAQQGTFAGLRPKTRVITSGNTYLDELDHTIIINVASGTAYLTTPSDPQDGQEYEIYTCHAPMDLVINFNGKTAYNFNAATNISRDTFTTDARRYIKLVYAGGQWWETYWYLNA